MPNWRSPVGANCTPIEMTISPIARSRISRNAIFYASLYNRSLRTGLAIMSPTAATAELPIARSIRAAETSINNWYQHAKLAA